MAVANGRNQLGKYKWVMLEVVADNDKVDTRGERSAAGLLQTIMVGNCLHLHIIGDDGPIKIQLLTNLRFYSVAGQGNRIVVIKTPVK